MKHKIIAIVFICIIYILFVVGILISIDYTHHAISEEKQTEFDIDDNNYKLFDIIPLNGSDYSNSTITINMSHIAEMKENNGSLIIEIRKEHEGTQYHGVGIK